MIARSRRTHVVWRGHRDKHIQILNTTTYLHVPHRALRLSTLGRSATSRLRRLERSREKSRGGRVCFPATRTSAERLSDPLRASRVEARRRRRGGDDDRPIRTYVCSVRLVVVGVRNERPGTGKLTLLSRGQWSLFLENETLSFTHLMVSWRDCHSLPSFFAMKKYLSSATSCKITASFKGNFKGSLDRSTWSHLEVCFRVGEKRFFAIVGYPESLRKHASCLRRAAR